MARSVKRPRAEPQAFHQLGVRGRKTGVVLQDRGERDEHGMQPLDSIFSPHESKPLSSEDESSDGAGSGAMEIASSDGPGPQTLLKNRHSITYPIPKSRSPIKTHLNSPAKKRPHLDYPSSPSRSGLTDDRDVTVTRRLDFADLPGKSKSLAGGDIRHASKSSRPSLQRLQEQVENDESEDDVQDLPADPTLVEPRDPTVSDLVNESMDMFDAMKSDNFSAAGFDSPAAYGLHPARRGINSPAGILQQSPAHPPSMTKPSPLSTISTIQKSQPEQSISRTKKKRPSLEATPADKGESDEEPFSREEQRQHATNMPPPPRPGIPAPTRPAMAAPRPIPKPPARVAPQMEAKSSRRGRGRPRKTERLTQKRRTEGPEDEDEGDETFMEIQRGPPMPRSRGLVSFRNGGTSATAGQYQTGRHSSYSNRGADFWGDIAKVSREHELELDLGLEESNVKNVVRLASDALPSARAPRSKTRTKARKNVHVAVEEDEEMEDWERDEGKVMGDIVLWEPEHEFFPPGDDEEVRVAQDRLAIAADAIEVKDIPDASFRFAKTLTVPFMGAGVVDLPSHTMKRPKNSRRMHMVFFLHYGKVQVTINEAQFRISAGGTWFVPRGNYYSITNDYDFPARIFFAQACEVAPQVSEGTSLAGEATSAAGGGGGTAAAPEENDEDDDEED
ncbi:hypothetical protein E4U21_001772 [Claviceps maximensis]|nr:hypothetical protein E4U21_001772 [Claviceps maximensis]